MLNSNLMPFKVWGKGNTPCKEKLGRRDEYQRLKKEKD